MPRKDVLEVQMHMLSLLAVAGRRAGGPEPFPAC
jgi:hypothetical protein